MSVDALLRDYVAETAAGVAEYGCLIDVCLANNCATVSSAGYNENERGPFTVRAALGGRPIGEDIQKTCYDNAIDTMCDVSQACLQSMNGREPAQIRAFALVHGVFKVQVSSQSGALLAHFVVHRWC